MSTEPIILIYVTFVHALMYQMFYVYSIFRKLWIFVRFCWKYKLKNIFFYIFYISYKVQTIVLVNLAKHGIVFSGLSNLMHFYFARKCEIDAKGYEMQRFCRQEPAPFLRDSRAICTQGRLTVPAAIVWNRPRRTAENMAAGTVRRPWVQMARQSRRKGAGSWRLQRCISSLTRARKGRLWFRVCILIHGNTACPLGEGNAHNPPPPSVKLMQRVTKNITMMLALVF